MKSTYLIITVVLLRNIITNAQCLQIVNPPLQPIIGTSIFYVNNSKGSLMQGLKKGEYHPTACYTTNSPLFFSNLKIAEFKDNAILTEFASLNFPVTIIGSSSHTYNCHYFAWYLTEGYPDNKGWLNATYGASSQPCIDPSTIPLPSGTFDTSVFVNVRDGSFVKVCDEISADKVIYLCKDHSASKSITYPNMWESKLGDGPTVRHTLIGLPINFGSNTDKTFYTSTKITGSVSTLSTGTRTFSVKNIPGATYSWTKSSGLTVVGSSNQNTFTVQRSGAMDAANNFVEVSITTPCSAINATRRVTFPVCINSSFQTTSQGCNGQFQYWNITSTPNNNGTNWNWTSSNSGNSQILIANPTSSSSLLV
jgi:hypothetical protein